MDWSVNAWETSSFGAGLATERVVLTPSRAKESRIPFRTGAKWRPSHHIDRVQHVSVLGSRRSIQSRVDYTRVRPHQAGGVLAKVRIYELAKELGLESKALLNMLKERGEFARSASSTVEPPVVRSLRAEFGRNGGSPEAPPTPAAPPSSPAARHAAAARRVGLAGVPKGDFEGLAVAEHGVTPASMEVGWRAGAVKEPRHPELLRNVAHLEERFPEFRRHREALLKLGSQVVYAGFCKERRFSNCGIAHVRFSGAIEAAFGLTREVLIFYSPHPDIQVRTYQTARDVLKSLGKELTPDLIFMSSPDPRLRVKLDDWLRPEFMAIPLEAGMEEDALSFISLIRDYIYSRDLFYETTPVRGSRFFGRRTLLQSLRDDVRSQRVVGLFGLRKSGKTSVLMQLADNVRATSTVTVLMDLEAFPSPPNDPTPDILSDLRLKLILELKQHDLGTQELSELPNVPTIVETKNALQTLLRKLEPDGVGVLLMLDEIEYLTPADQIDVAEGAMPQIAQMLGALRSLVQESPNFTFILSGLTSAIVESGRLYGRPNPLFSWAKAQYLGPFERSEADELAMSIGGKMGIEIEGDALEALFEASGGHAFLYRNLASKVVESLPLNVYRRRITRSDVLRALIPWKASISGNVTEMLDHVRRYYPTEAILLDVLRESSADFSLLAGEEPQAVHHLLNLGLVHADGGTYSLNSFLELM